MSVILFLSRSWIYDSYYLLRTEAEKCPWKQVGYHETHQVS